MSDTFSFLKILAPDTTSIQLIADWYQAEWTIARERTINMLSSFPQEGVPFHFLLTDQDEALATAGLHVHVGLLEAMPVFKKYGPWLALVYTPEEKRSRGYASVLCRHIENEARALGFKKIYLFTFTAESLYAKAGWKVLERLEYKGHDTVVMEKAL